MRLKLLTFNTLGTPFFARDITNRYKKIAETIQSGDYDIVCLQEIFSHYNHYLFNKLLTNFPYRINKPTLLGLHGGLAIYSKLPLTYETFHIYTYPKGMAIPFYTRLARSGILVCKLKDFPLTLATTHLTTDTVHDLTPKNKRFKLISNQVTQASDIYNRFAQEENSMILAGDFNISKGSLLYKQFLDATAAEDVFAGHAQHTYSPDRTPYRFPAEKATRIDFMFYKKGKKKITFEKLQHIFEEQVLLNDGRRSYVSDHIALSATLILI